MKIFESRWVKILRKILNNYIVLRQDNLIYLSGINITYFVKVIKKFVLVWKLMAIKYFKKFNIFTLLLFSSLKCVFLASCRL